MRDSIPRIRSVKFKSGGEVRILPSATDPDDIKKQFIIAARQVADLNGYGEMQAFVIVAIAQDGSSQSIYKIDPAGHLDGCMLPSIVADNLRRMMWREDDKEK